MGNKLTKNRKWGKLRDEDIEYFRELTNKKDCMETAIDEISTRLTEEIFKANCIGTMRCEQV